MNNDTTDRQDREQHAAPDTAAEGPVVGYELTLLRNEPAECTLFLVESGNVAEAIREEMWITAKEGSFVDLDASR